MNENLKSGLTLIIALLTGLSVGILFNRCHRPKTNDLIIASPKEVIDLKEELDSVENQIDTIYIELKTIDQNYKKVVDSIISNDPDSDYCFFINYIGSQRERLDSTILSNRSK